MNYFVTKTTFHYVTDSEMSRNDEIERSLGMNTLESFLFVRVFLPRLELTPLLL